MVHKLITYNRFNSKETPSELPRVRILSRGKFVFNDAALRYMYFKHGEGLYVIQDPLCETKWYFQTTNNNDSFKIGNIRTFSSVNLHYKICNALRLHELEDLEFVIQKTVINESMVVYQLVFSPILLKQKYPIPPEGVTHYSEFYNRFVCRDY